jgi:hypothetical protein
LAVVLDLDAASTDLVGSSVDLDLHGSSFMVGLITHAEGLARLRMCP